MLSSSNKSEFDKHVIACSQRFNQRGESAEWQTASFLVDNLRPKMVGDYRILMNYNLEKERRTGSFLEIDLIVVNHFGVFLIEVKDWYGAIQAYDDYWLQRTNKKHDDIFGTVNFKAKNLFGKLFGTRGEVRDIGQVSVMGSIVLFQGIKTFQNLSTTYSNSKNVFELGSELIHALSSTNYLHHGANNQLITDNEIKRITDALYQSNQVGADIISNYIIDKKLPPGDLYDAFEAKSISIEGKRVRVKRYRLPKISIDDDENNKTFENFERNATVAARLETHTNILQTYDFFEDNKRWGVFYEITELIVGERLDQLIANCTSALPLEEQVKYLRALCDALNHVHRKGVYHRNINPETVYITNSGVVKLADFDFAKLPEGNRTISTPGHLLVDNFLTAPELLIDASNATPMSDIYSLGGLWYLLATLPKHPNKIDFDLMNQVNIPPTARDLMTKMLAKVPANRPQNVSDVLLKLKKIVD